MSKKRMPTLALAAVALGSMLCLTSCDNGSDPASVTKISGIIRAGTATAMSIGLVAVPDSAEADQIARELKEILGNSVLPILNGDEAGLASGLEKLLTLDFLSSDPKYAKAKAILESALPLLKANLPADLLDKPLTEVPADVKAYVTAFFVGVHDGASSYLGDRDVDNRWTELRQKLAQ